ncbi:HAD hydrolase family protein [Fodinibius sp. Rm-B-1B1-1]|uniref:HAD hydrolase family protein n=1 Tax=Fodinibius alkaliphilus TaxID=3140241 RepID=UPI00315B1BA4
MIKLFITDLDGCISTPFKTPEWDLLSQIRRLNEQSSHDMAVPSLSICSGRPFPYVEAVAQWLGITNHVVFESAGVFELASNTIKLHPSFDDEAELQVRELKQWLNNEIVPLDDNFIIEFTKKMDAGIIHLDTEVIQEIYPRIKEYVSDNYPRFEVHDTDVSINIVLSENNKRTGIHQLCEIMDLSPDEVAYIGDSSGDIPGLKFVGKPFAPKNAAESVKREAEVLDGEVTKAVLEAYRQIIRENRKKLAAAG